MRDTDLAWLAALIDGEGSVMLTKHKNAAGNPRYRPVISISNTDLRLMVALSERFGLGQTYEHRTPERLNHKKRAYTWRLNVGQIEQIAPHVRPWLVLKGEQLDLLLEAMVIKRRITPGQEEFKPHLREPLLERLDSIHQQIQNLNRKGRSE